MWNLYHKKQKLIDHEVIPPPPTWFSVYRERKKVGGKDERKMESWMWICPHKWSALLKKGAPLFDFFVSKRTPSLNYTASSISLRAGHKAHVNTLVIKYIYFVFLGAVFRADPLNCRKIAKARTSLTSIKSTNAYLSLLQHTGTIRITLLILSSVCLFFFF